MGRLIRHEIFSRFCPALPVSPLMASIISSSFRTLLMTEVRSSPLYPASYGAAPIAPVALPAVTAAANPKQSAATWCDAKSLTENIFSCLYHPRLKARLDISRRSWQPKAVWLDNSRKRVSTIAPVGDTTGVSSSRPSEEDYTKTTMLG